MTCVAIAVRIGCGMTLGLGLTACAWLPGSRSEPTPVSAPATIEIISAGLLASRSGDPELGLTLSNPENTTLWVSVHFQTPGGQHDCVTVKEIDPGGSGLFLCSQPSIRPDTNYLAKVSVFTNLEQTTLTDTQTAELRFDRGDVQALDRASRPPSR